KPAITMTTLTTIAMTGRRMKRSVSFMMSPVLGRRVGARVGRRDVVVDGDRSAVLELERARRDHGRACLEAVLDLDEVATSLTEAHEGLLGGERVAFAAHDVDRVAVGRVEDGRVRDRDHRAAR